MIGICMSVLAPLPIACACALWSLPWPDASRAEFLFHVSSSQRQHLYLRHSATTCGLELAHAPLLAYRVSKTHANFLFSAPTTTHTASHEQRRRWHIKELVRRRAESRDRLSNEGEHKAHHSRQRMAPPSFRLGLGAELAGAEKYTQLPGRFFRSCGTCTCMSSIASIDLPRILGRLRPYDLSAKGTVLYAARYGWTRDRS